MSELYRKIEELDPDRRNMIITVVEGSSIGEKALISDHRLVCSSVSGGHFARFQDEAEAVDVSGMSVVGGCRVFSEFLCREKRLVVCGAGHVSIPVIRMGRMLGFHVIVLEDRPEFADHASEAEASEVFCEAFEDGLDRIEGDEDTYFVIVTRGHRYDQVCLERIVRKKNAYIGMIGSRKRSAMVKELVIAGGADPEKIAGIHSPIGLDIGAETPEEIAVSIMAEIIKVKNQRRRCKGYPSELLDAVLGRTSGNSSCEAPQKILATIISRKGSAPRTAGTKMLILPDGSCVGTAGGGCAEAEIVKKALRMMRSQETAPQIYHVDMTGRDAGDEGMVCGGVIDVFLEAVVEG